MLPVRPLHKNSREPSQHGKRSLYNSERKALYNQSD